MLNSKMFIEEDRKYIIDILKNEKLQKHFVRGLIKGCKDYSKSRELDKDNFIESYTNSKGIERARKVANSICNDINNFELGITADVFSNSKIPIIKIENIFMTIKSLKNSEGILNNKSNYIKKFSKVNYKLNPQINMLDLEDESIVEHKLKGKYYGILVYNFSQANTLNFIEFIFLNEEAKSIILRIKVSQDVILSCEDKITHKDRSTITEEQVKGNSLKKLLKIK